MPEQRLNVHELGAGLKQPRRVGVPELVRRDLLIDAGPLDQAPQVSPDRVRPWRLAP